MFSKTGRRQKSVTKEDSFFVGKGKCLNYLPSQQRVDVAFENVGYFVRTSGRKNEYKNLLKDISGQLHSSELTAILGPSGAGKSTLMNVLAGYKIRNVTGTIKVNGQDRDLGAFRRLSCYIMENDELLPHLTVTESMMVSANLKLPEMVSCKEKSKIVDEILEKLGLSECKDTKADKLSKGQRKRLSIAQELVNNPPLMFFDEPTSGLDAQSCYQCIRLLKSLATDGRTIVCTIHQPSARLFEMFDRLFVLAEGTCVYKGSVSALLPYLKSQSLICPPYHNPADFVIEVACGEYGNVVPQLAQCVQEGLCEKLESLCIADKNKILQLSDNDHANQDDGRRRRRLAESIGGSKRITNGELLLVASGGGGCSEEPASAMRKTLSCSSNHDITEKDEDSVTIQLPVMEEKDQTRCPKVRNWHLCAASPCTQFYVLFLRTLKCIIRDTHLTQLRLLAHIVVGILIGVLYYGIGNEATKTVNNTASLFFSILFIMFTAMMPTVVTFPLEMSVFIREHLNCWYDLKSYYFAKTMADVPFQVLFPVAYSTIVYWMTGQPCDAFRFLSFLLLSILISLISQSLGLLIGAATSLQVAVFLGPATAIPILLFCGFFVSFDTIPSYLQWLSYLSYIRYAYEGMVMTIYGFNRPPMVCQDLDNSLCIMTNPKLVLQTFDIDEGNFWLNLTMLLVFFFVFRLGCYFVLRWRVCSEK